MILVIGASGGCGTAVTGALVRRGAQVRGFVRGEERAAVARAAGAAEIAIGDLENVATVRAAIRGVEGVFHIGPRWRSDEASIGRMMIDAARHAGVRKFVYLSALHPVASKMLHHEAKRQVEEALLETDLEFTVLHAARFMQNVLRNWTQIMNEGVYQEPFSADVPMSDVDFEDVAEVAAIALTQPGYSCTGVELASEGMLTRRQVAAIMSEVLGKPIRAAACSPDEWLARVKIESPYAREALTRMYDYYDKYGFRCGNGLVLRTILGREPVTFREFLKRIAAVAS